MSEMLVMRRANGEILTEDIDGKLYIPVWSSIEALSRYKERNPELMVYLPTRVDRSLMKRITARQDAEAATEFFLLSDDSPEAELRDGRPVSTEEVFPATAAMAAS